MEIKQIGKIKGGQDGAIYGSELFRFDAAGNCNVYELSDMKTDENGEIKAIASFKLSGTERIVPHSNAVCFGCDFYDKADKYPLLYSNVYNNYASSKNPLIGVCCVYRLQRTENEFEATLVQLIEIGFCENTELWRASPEKHGVRPYGNFLVDTKTHSYYAFVMRSEELGTRYFRFSLPSVNDGEYDPRFNAKRVVLNVADIKESFVQPFYHYIQGAILHEGKIYSTEGFSSDKVNRPAIRILELESKKEKYVDIMELGFMTEPEFIDFWQGDCYYSDCYGNFYTIDL